MKCHTLLVVAVSILVAAVSASVSAEEKSGRDGQTSSEEDVVDLFAAGDFSSWSRVDGKPVGEGWSWEFLLMVG